jgi:hypothetical protein
MLTEEFLRKAKAVRLGGRVYCHQAEGYGRRLFDACALLAGR